MAANPLSTAAITSFAAVKRQRLDVQLKQLEFHALLHRKLDVVHLFESFLTGGQAFLPFEGLQFIARERGNDVLVGDQRQHRLCFDLVLGENKLGQVSLLRGKPFTTREARTASRLIEILRYPLNNALAHHVALMKAMTDRATGLFNQKALDQELPREMRLARRSEQPLALMVIAIDYLESMTEHHGDGVARDAWNTIASALREQLRGSDRLFCTDDDHFLAILNMTDIDDALIVASRLQKSVDLSVADDNVSAVLTASVGITELDGNDDPDRFVRRTMKALKSARRHGRNQVKAIQVEYPVGHGFDPSVA